MKVFIMSPLQLLRANHKNRLANKNKIKLSFCRHSICQVLACRFLAVIYFLMGKTPLTGNVQTILTHTRAIWQISRFENLLTLLMPDTSISIMHTVILYPFHAFHSGYTNTCSNLILQLYNTCKLTDINYFILGVQFWNLLKACPF